jgi:hypothetical protein
VSRVLPRIAGVAAGAFATLWLAACGGLSADAQAVADACGKVPGTTAESCQCYARELSGKLKPELMKLATYAQTDPAKLFDPTVIGNVSANDVMAVTSASGAALKTCKIVS